MSAQQSLGCKQVFRLCFALQVLTPLQYARSVALSDVHNVDALAIATYLHDELSEQGLPSTDSLHQLAAKVAAIRAEALQICR